MRLSARCASRPPLAEHPFPLCASIHVGSTGHVLSPPKLTALLCPAHSSLASCRTVNTSNTNSAASALRLCDSLHLTPALLSALFCYRPPTNEDTFGGCLTHTCSIDDNQGLQSPMRQLRCSLADSPVLHLPVKLVCIAKTDFPCICPVGSLPHFAAEPLPHHTFAPTSHAMIAWGRVSEPLVLLFGARPCHVPPCPSLFLSHSPTLSEGP